MLFFDLLSFRLCRFVCMHVSASEGSVQNIFRVTVSQLEEFMLS